MGEWNKVRDLGVDVMVWWELLVKPGMRKLLMERGKEMKKERLGFTISVEHDLLYFLSYVVLSI